ncbi:fungal-trans domain-containing protein [Favolaschia claudopus]|uniref:Fungal-trans domain-containing protein n=1 Tax=Favolaschia claudopus TaxID=2862362 RepID=A0AAW0EDE9_9AGAR
MSNNESLEASPSRSQSPEECGPSKRQRPLRCCDMCRKRKVRCDGQDGGTCSRCVSSNRPCTYNTPQQKRGRKAKLVDGLRKEIATLKAHIRTLSVCALCSQPLSGPSEISLFSNVSNVNVTEEVDDASATDSEHADSLDELTSLFSQFDLDQSATGTFFGSTSPLVLTDHAFMLKESHDGQPLLFNINARRRHFWDLLPWDRAASAIQPQYVYPPRDLIDCLLQSYLANVHPTYPFLHFSSFARSVMEGLHLVDTNFGGVLLAVLAVAARYSKDPRVFVEGDNALSAGWEYANQIWITRTIFNPTIHETQMYGLLTLYATGSTPQNAWLYHGLGIRCLHHRGVHRRKPEGHVWSHEDKLWNRAFWAFVALDRMVSAFTGRPSSLPMEEYDVEPPFVLDGDWDEGFALTERPPPLSYFICDTRLCEILGDVMRRLYASKRTKQMMGWDKLTVAHFDSTMNKFLDSIPLHLRWNSEKPPKGVYFSQSATLHISFHYTLIVIHRPGIHRPDYLTSTSLSICAHAARTILRTAGLWFRETQEIPLPNIVTPVFVAAIILAVNAIAAKRTGLAVDRDRDDALFATAVEMLELGETRYQTVGRLVDVLRAISPFNDENKVTHTAACSFYPEPVYTEQITAGFPSIKDLLADGSTAFGDDLLSMWMGVPSDLGSWDMYFENGGLADVQQTQ